MSMHVSLLERFAQVSDKADAHGQRGPFPASLALATALVSGVRSMHSTSYFGRRTELLRLSMNIQWSRRTTKSGSVLCNCFIDVSW